MQWSPGCNRQGHQSRNKTHRKSTCTLVFASNTSAGTAGTSVDSNTFANEMYTGGSLQKEGVFTEQRKAHDVCVHRQVGGCSRPLAAVTRRFELTAVRVRRTLATSVAASAEGGSSSRLQMLIWRQRSSTNPCRLTHSPCFTKTRWSGLQWGQQLFVT